MEMYANIAAFSSRRCHSQILPPPSRLATFAQLMMLFHTTHYIANISPDFSTYYIQCTINTYSVSPIYIAHNITHYILFRLIRHYLYLEYLPATYVCLYQLLISCR